MQITANSIENPSIRLNISSIVTANRIVHDMNNVDTISIQSYPSKEFSIPTKSIVYNNNNNNDTINGDDNNNDNNSEILSNRFCCMSREFWTCLLLSSIVIGLPIAIIIMLINLPRLSSQRDTRQQHYILLAFGLPFSCVIIVALLYGIYSLIRRIRRGPNHSRIWNKSIDFGHNSIKSKNSLTSMDEEPKLYSLVTQVMTNQRISISTPNISPKMERNYSLQ
ncbi:hypothetical protein DERP_008591 [Dermatophagoides pteronyssinus]|uniref:Uncharacterized protein n=2 Tax=Dermatophagoides pteronyssinus TaxID=6956 RepID=A0ABQ8IXD6_DERPT|nr:transmembrane protein 41 homolog [Dermatophagoides pteronyssinus]KAH9414750.1 hypothetical protein DERP_008591 [Dermatophagoides pteronyssinus]